jgi:hypothetical protein
LLISQHGPHTVRIFKVTNAVGAVGVKAISRRKRGLRNGIKVDSSTAFFYFCPTNEQLSKWNADGIAIIEVGDYGQLARDQITFM